MKDTVNTRAAWNDLDIMVFMAMSLDGYIAGPNNFTFWSDAEWENYASYLSKADCLIIGRKTYELMQQAKEFDDIGHPNFIAISQEGNLGIDNAAKTPKEALELCKIRNWNKVIVGGGFQLNSYFLTNNFADMLHLDIEPIALGSGTPMFPQNWTTKLEYLNSETLKSGTLSVNYKLKGA